MERGQTILAFVAEVFFPIESEFSRKLANSFDPQKYAYLLNQIFKIQENDSEEIIINSSNIKHNKNRQQPKNKSMFVVKYPTSLNNSIDELQEKKDNKYANNPPYEP